MGTNRQSGTLLLSNDVSGFHYDANFIVTEQTEAGVRRAQYAQTLSISHPLKKFTISSEIWHFTQPYFKSECGGQPMGTLVSRPPKFGDRCRLRSRFHKHIHALGRIQDGFNLPVATSGSGQGKRRLAAAKLFQRRPKSPRGSFVRRTTLHPGPCEDRIRSGRGWSKKKAALIAGEQN